MKEEFVCDIGDYAKYGLLRWLCGHQDGEKKLRLAVIWCYTKQEINEKAFRYLEEEAGLDFQQCDPELHESMKNIYSSFKQFPPSPSRLKALEENPNGIFPENTLFHSDVLKKSNRGAYVKNAIDKIREEKDIELIFLDPDNGMHIKDQNTKYVLYDEIKKFIELNRGLIVYQSFGRHDKGATHDVQMKGWQKDLREQFNLNENPFILRWKFLHPRAFIIITTTETRGILKKRLNALVNNKCHWSRHFELFNEKSVK